MEYIGTGRTRTLHSRHGKRLMPEPENTPCGMISILPINRLDDAEDLAARAVDRRVCRILRNEPHAVRRDIQCFAGRFILQQSDHDIAVARLRILPDDNQIIVHTLPGSANPIAAAIDHARWENVIGTLAGDDTVLLIVQDTETVPKLVKLIVSLMKE